MKKFVVGNDYKILKNKKMENVTTSNWKAWISKNETASKNLKFQITGDVDTHSTDFAFLKKKAPQGFNPTILLLELKVEKGTIPAKNPQQVHYSQPVEKKMHYTAVDIIFKGKIIAQIKDIQIVASDNDTDTINTESDFEISKQ